jgi:hypothetical protein
MIAIMIKPSKLKPLGDDFHYQKIFKHISSWIYAHIKK